MRKLTIFSIITPSFQQLDWLRLCIASVRDQISWETGVRSFEFEPNSQERKNQPFSCLLAIEHIIQDAGSPGIEDFAREIGADFYRDGKLQFAAVPSDDSSLASGQVESPFPCHNLSATSNYRIAVYCEKDAGMYDAINRGLSRATGELSAYLNCDEQYLPGALQRVADWFYTNPRKDVLFADAILLGEDGSALSYRRTVLPDRWHTRLCHLNTLTCSTFFRRKVFEAGHRFPENKKVIGDGIWVNGMLSSKVPMGYLREPTSVFTFTGANLSEMDRGEASEQALWGREPDAPPHWLKFPVRVLHRLKKFFAGAYIKRNMEISIFRPGNASARHTFSVCNLNYEWPKTL